MTSINRIRGFWLLGLCSLLIIAPGLLCAQEAFTPAAEDSGLIAGLFQKYQRQYQKEIENLPSTNRKDLTEVYQLRWKNIQEKFDQKEIYTQAASQKYLDQLVAVIRQGNPSLSGAGFSCYISRSFIPNAAYIGEGIILFNMGLFQRMENEGQVAFVLCHEISHYMLHHSENSIRQYVATINSKDVQEALRRIKGSQYRKHEQLQTLVKGLTFDSRRHSRDHEGEADSMAVQLMRNTPFALSCALSALALLDTIDADSLNMSLYLPRLFNAPGYPFRNKWLAHDEGLLGGHARIVHEELADSLKTHPDCRKRILQLTGLTKGWTQPLAERFVVDSLTFVSLRDDFRYETIEYAYTSANYTESLFLTLELMNIHSNDAFLITQVGKLMNGFYHAQKKHTLSKITDLPSPGYPPNYNLLLQFIQNLYLEDLAAISYHYLKQYQDQMSRYPPFKEVYQESERLANN